MPLPIKLVSVFLMIAYFWGVMTTQHYAPSSLGFYENTYVILFSLLGVGAYFYYQKVGKVSYATLMWLALFVLLLLQPIFSKIGYFDSLVVEAGVVLVCLLLSLVMDNSDDNGKRYIIDSMSWTMIAVAVLTILTQIAQLYAWDKDLEPWVFPVSGGASRLGGNLAQPNQASFVMALGIASLLYLFISHQKRFFQEHSWSALALIILVVFGVGIGLSTSRGGLILALATPLMLALFCQNTLKKRFLLAVLPTAILSVGYALGSAWVSSVMQSEATALGRMVNENTTYLRVNLIKDAGSAFGDNPVTGVGFGNIMQYVLDNSMTVHWFANVGHVHNIVMQIASELGILGLLVFFGFVAVGVARLRFNLSYYLGFAYTILGIVFLYSLSEFPLWMPKFLILAVLFLAVVNHKFINLKVDYKPLALTLSLLGVMMSSYYLLQYQKYIDAYYAISNQNNAYEYRVERFESLPSVFGFSKYKDMMLYILTPVSEDNLQAKIALGEKVLPKFINPYVLTKQADLYVLANNHEMADLNFKRACRYQLQESCPDVLKSLQQYAEQNPTVYQPYLDRYTTWHEKTKGNRVDNP